MADSYLVYRLDRSMARTESTAVTPSPALREWTPSLMNVAPGDLIAERTGFIKNWLFHLPSIARSTDPYKVFMLQDGERIVAQCLVTKPSARFPFMGPDELQIGLVYTAPQQRTKGLARRLVAAVIASHRRCPAYWWITSDDNIASQKVAEGNGFTRFGRAIRTSRFGIPHFHLADEAR
jgi:RimJ/RimL family protein N-acetyltransferase